MAQATYRVELATYVTCPIIRYHPAVVAQKAATLQLLSEGRFILGLGIGENLNEHITGEGWPPIAQRQDMLVEAADNHPGAAVGRPGHVGGRLLPGRLGPGLGRARRRRTDRDCRVRREVGGAVRAAGRSPRRR